MKNKLELELNQKVLIDRHEIPKRYSIALFKDYYPGNENPYLVEIKNENLYGAKIGSYLMGVKEGDIKDIKYKPYTDPKIEWIGKELIGKDKVLYRIVAIRFNHLIELCPIKNNTSVENRYVAYSDLIDYTCDGEPFGELIK